MRSDGLLHAGYDSRSPQKTQIRLLALSKKALKRFEDVPWRFFRKVMAAVDRAAVHVNCLLPPSRQHIIAIESRSVAAAAPQDKHRGSDLTARSVVSLVMIEINTGCRAIVLTRTVNRFGSKAADVFGQRAIVDECGLPGPAKMAQNELTGWYRRNHPLKHFIGLGHERPVPGIQRPIARGVPPHVACRLDVQQGDLLHPFGMV